MSYKYQLMSTENSKLKKDGIVSINLPPVITCPGAGECKKYCYACIGQQAMGNPKEFRARALKLFKEDPKEFEAVTIAEVHRSGRRFVRWHDSGDIMNISYLKMMVRVANHFPEVKFYTYSKSIKILMKYGYQNLPANLKIIQSYGGKHDHLIDESFPFARVFLTEKDIPKDFVNCTHSDFAAANQAVRIGIAARGGRKKHFTVN